MAKSVLRCPQHDASIRVSHDVAEEYDVSIEGKATTTHRVHLQEKDRLRLAGENVPPEDLIAQSFAFLLDREPASSILREFDLLLISRYFPEYEKEISAKMRLR
ncbi:MAG: hypothetical protein ABI839_05890 [Verrucomicrobiota bacterium]